MDTLVVEAPADAPQQAPVDDGGVIDTGPEFKAGWIDDVAAEKAAWERTHANFAAREQEVRDLTRIAREKAAVVAVAQAELVAAVDALRSMEGRLGATLRQWVGWQCGLTRAETNRICRLSENLGDLPRTAEMLRSGAISEAVADTIAQVATPDSETKILGVVTAATGDQLQRVIHEYAAQVRERNARTKRPKGDLPSKVTWQHRDGRFVGTFDLDAADGSTLEAALEAVGDRLRPTEEDIDTNPVGDGQLRPEEISKVTKVDLLLGLAERWR